MISLRRMVESYNVSGQYYDLGRDFANFRRMIDGADQQIRQQYEKAISEKLVGKRVRARASRGYKQYVKDYEFDIARITLDDYYDNFVVVAYDSTTPKAKEYFLKPGFKVQILGSSTGQPSPQKGNKPGDAVSQKPTVPPQQHQTQSDTMPPQSTVQPGSSTNEKPLREAPEKQSGLYDAYPIDQIEKDIKQWLPTILIKPDIAMRDFIRGLGWQRDLGRGTIVALYDLKIPSDYIKPEIKVDHIKELITGQNISQTGSASIQYDVSQMKLDDTKDEWQIRIKKTTTK
jgi:hypothetical protein